MRKTKKLINWTSGLSQQQHQQQQQQRSQLYQRLSYRASPYLPKLLLKIPGYKFRKSVCSSTIHHFAKCHQNLFKTFWVISFTAVTHFISLIKLLNTGSG